MLALEDILCCIKELHLQTKVESVEQGIQQPGCASIVFDSRKVVQNSLFIAIKGHVSDGHDYIEIAIEKGAIEIIFEVLRSQIHLGVYYILVSDAHRALGLIASLFYGNPSRELTLVGVTGTNGKTSVTTMLYQLMTALGQKSGLISTVQNVIGNEIIPSTHTTPDALSINHLLRQMVEAGCEYVFMEVSSHAIHQERIAGLQFKGAVFTNITHDHLDYHGTFEEYIRVKKLFFDNLSKDAFALVNTDDKRGTVMLQNTIADKKSFALKRHADFKVKILENALNGLHLTINKVEIYTRVVGEFNAYNIAAVYGVAIELGFDSDEILIPLSNIVGAQGRFQMIQSTTSQKIGIVDYAHTPDALENVLTTIEDTMISKREIVTVVGCGGDRDQAKRPLMAGVSCQKSDKVIFTTDNPRSEDPKAIITQMTAGVTGSMQKVIVIEDREQAIKTACMMALNDAIILIAGKGHEKYQEINGVKHHFDDLEILKKYI